MKDGAPVQKHLNTFNSIMSKLTALDIRKNKEEKISALFYSMPKSWNNLIINLIHIETLKMESVVALILTEEIR